MGFCKFWAALLSSFLCVQTLLLIEKLAYLQARRGSAEVRSSEAKEESTGTQKATKRSATSSTQRRIITH